MAKFYITTPIAYPNANPHIGHALEFIGTDIIARAHRLRGDDVFFSTGTDEHGQKMHNTALNEGVETKELADRYVEKFKELVSDLEISYDYFVRTSQGEHYKIAQDIWKKCEERGDIYKKKYKALYCEGCESFKTKSNLDENGKCPDHPTKELQELEEENYFFALSKYQDDLLRHYEENPAFVQPDFRKNEILNVIKAGLEDISISREKEKLEWGIPVPGDDSQVMYVWFDALTNYLTSVAGQEDKWWPANVHIVGKDIIRHHAALWPAMLMSAGMDLPKQVMVHGHITAGGVKMGKSNNNVIDPFEVIDIYGIESFRLLLVETIDFYDDGDITFDLLEQKYSKLLANGIGNLYSRSTMMVEKFTDGKTRKPTADDGCKALSERVWKEYNQAIDQKLPGKAIKAIFQLVDWANEYIDENKPWELAKQEQMQGRLLEVVSNIVEVNRQIAILLLPVIPQSAQAMLEGLGQSSISSENYEDTKLWGQCEEDNQVQKASPLFPRIEK